MDIEKMNLNESANANNQNPYFAGYLSKNAPKWAKYLFIMVLAILIIGILYSILRVL